jgi:hypothetical protein
MRFFRFFLATLWIVGLSVSSLPAHAAGTISVSPPTWSNRVEDRLINKFNRKDCVDGDGTAAGIRDGAVARFSVALRGAPTNALFQVWSGTGCDQYANRSPTAVSRTCTLLTPDPLAPLDQNVTIYLRDMVATYGDTVDHSVEQCDASTTAGLQTRNLYFVVSDPSTNATVATGTNSAWAFTYDVKAPPPPTKVSAGSGDGSLVTSFTAPPGETNLLHYKFYCSLISAAPVVDGTAGTGGTAGTETGGTGASAGTDTGGTAGTDTGGTAGTDTAGTDTGGTAGTDTGGTAAGGTTSGTSGTASTAGTAGTTTTAVDPECQSAVLIPGQFVRSDADGLIDCGEITAQAATGGETKSVLTNDIKYAVAIATEDNVNNVGVLSALACNVPKDTTGFIEAYGEAGGRAGGGFCAFAPAKNGAWAMLVAFIIGAGALARRRS